MMPEVGRGIFIKSRTNNQKHGGQRSSANNMGRQGFCATSDKSGSFSLLHVTLAVAGINPCYATKAVIKQVICNPICPSILIILGFLGCECYWAHFVAEIHLGELFEC